MEAKEGSPSALAVQSSMSSACADGCTIRHWHRCRVWEVKRLACPYRGLKGHSTWAAEEPPTEPERPDPNPTPIADLSVVRTPENVESQERTRAIVDQKTRTTVRDLDKPPPKVRTLPPLLFPDPPPYVPPPLPIPERRQPIPEPIPVRRPLLPRGIPIGVQPFEEGLYAVTMDEVHQVREPFDRSLGGDIWNNLRRYDFDWQEAMWAGATALLMRQLVVGLGSRLQSVSSNQVGQGEMRLSRLLGQYRGVRPGGFMFSSSARIAAMFPHGVRKTGEIVP